jgi:hypothetical protein
VRSPGDKSSPFFGLLVEHECPRCHQPVELPLGEICGACRQSIERRAGRIGRLVAMVSTVAVAIYVVLRMPRDPTARVVGGVSIGLWYILTYLLVKRVLREYLK